MSNGCIVTTMFGRTTASGHQLTAKNRFVCILLAASRNTEKVEIHNIAHIAR